MERAVNFGTITLFRDATPSIIKLGSRFHDYRNEQWNGKGYVWYEMHLPKATSDGTHTGKWVNADTGDTYDVWPNNIAGTYYQQKRLTSDMVDFDASAETYTGQPITKAVSVEGLTEGEDYKSPTRTPMPALLPLLSPASTLAPGNQLT